MSYIFLQMLYVLCYFILKKYSLDNKSQLFEILGVPFKNILHEKKYLKSSVQGHNTVVYDVRIQFNYYTISHHNVYNFML